MIEKLYTVEEVAELASVTGRTIRNYLKSGKLVGRKIGGQWRFPESEVQRLLNGGSSEDEEQNTNSVGTFSPQQQQQFSPQGIAQPFPQATPQATNLNFPYSVSPQVHSPTPSYPNETTEQDFSDTLNETSSSFHTQESKETLFPFSSNQFHESSDLNTDSTVISSQERPSSDNFSIDNEENAQKYSDNNNFPISPPEQPYFPNYPSPSHNSFTQTGFGNPNYSAPLESPPSSVSPSPQGNTPSSAQSSFPPSPQPPSAAGNYTSNYSSSFPTPPTTSQKVPNVPSTPYYSEQEKAVPPPAENPYLRTPPIQNYAPPQPVHGESASGKVSALAELLNAYASGISGNSTENMENNSFSSHKKPISSPENEIFQLSDVGKQVTKFMSQVHDCSNGPQICAVIDLYQSLESAKITSERLTEMAEIESENGTLCNCFVEFDSRYYVARYTLLGSSYYLARCIEMIG